MDGVVGLNRRFYITPGLQPTYVKQAVISLQEIAEFQKFVFRMTRRLSSLSTEKHFIFKLKIRKRENDGSGLAHILDPKS